jgi:hypothetical protein
MQQMESNFQYLDSYNSVIEVEIFLHVCICRVQLDIQTTIASVC